MKKVFKKVSGVLAASLISGGLLCGCSQDWSHGIDGRQAATGSSTDDAASPAPAANAGTKQRRQIATFANLPDRGDLVDYRQSATRRSGAYTWHAAALSEDHAINSIVRGQMTVTAPDGTPIKLQYDRHIEHPQGNWTWVGHTADGGQALITFGPTAAFGSIPQGGGKAPLRLTMSDGRAWIVATDRAKVRNLDIEATDPTGPDYLIPPKLAAAGLGSMGLDSAGLDSTGMLASEMSTAAAPAAAGTVIDVLVGYTNGYAADLGGQAAARTRIQNLVDVTNQAYANSQIDARVRLVHSMQVNYTDTTDNGDALEALTGFQAPSTPIEPDPAFAGLRAARDEYGADLVTLVRKFNTPENGGCGIAWLIGGGQSGINPNDDYFGYSVVSDGQDEGTDGSYFCRTETFAHELGHLMGSQHDVETAKGEDGVLDDDEYGAYPYSFGYKTTPTTGDFYTVMAYGDDGQRAFRIFSTPAVDTCQDRACGTASQNDNARSLRQTMPTIAGFRASQAPPPSGGQAEARNDFNGDGHSDILWRNFSDGRNTIWRSANSGTDSAVTRVGNFAWIIAGVGDFGGDGDSDIIWRDTSNGRNTIWRSGNSATDQAVTRVGNLDWHIAGVGDFDGDGRSDILWRDTSNGRNTIWLSGNSATDQGVTRVGNLDWRIAGVGDFDGDGRSDILWRDTTNGRNTIWLSGNSATSQAVTRVGNLDWRIAGVDDFDGDGRADILWRDPATGRNTIWKSGNSATSMAVATLPSQPLGASWVVAGTGDFDGDGAAGIVWRHQGNGANVIWRSASANAELAVTDVSNLAWFVEGY